MIDSGVSPTPRSPATWSTAPTSPTTRASTSRATSTPSGTERTSPASSTAVVQARVVNVKVADHEGDTWLRNLLARIDWANAPRRPRGLNVASSMSRPAPRPTCSCRNDPLALAVEQAWDEGLVVITSAGGGTSPTASTRPPMTPTSSRCAEDSVPPRTSRMTAWRRSSSRGRDARPRRRRSGRRHPLDPRARLVPRRGLPRRWHRRRLAGAGALTVRRGRLRRRRAPRRRAARPEPDQIEALLRSTARPLAETDTAVRGASVINVAAAARSAARSCHSASRRRRGGAWRAGFATDVDRGPSSDRSAVIARQESLGRVIAGAASLEGATVGSNAGARDSW